MQDWSIFSHIHPKLNWTRICQKWPSPASGVLAIILLNKVPYNEIYSSDYESSEDVCGVPCELLAAPDEAYDQDPEGVVGKWTWLNNVDCWWGDVMEAMKMRLPILYGCRSTNQRHWMVPWDVRGTYQSIRPSFSFSPQVENALFPGFQKGQFDHIFDRSFHPKLRPNPSRFRDDW
jgi:hypothetical protein